MYKFNKKICLLYIIIKKSYDKYYQILFQICITFMYKIIKILYHTKNKQIYYKYYFLTINIYSRNQKIIEKYIIN